MAPAEINLSQTRRWLAQLHTTNLPPVSAPSSSISSGSTSSSSSTHSRGSVDYASSASSCTICASAGCGGGTGGGTCTSSPTTTMTTTTATTTTPSSSPLTETRARSLQRLCALSDAHRAAEDEVVAAAAAPSGNERFAPSNINYIRATNGSGVKGPKMDAQSMGWSRWARRQSVQSLGAVERDAAPRFSLSKLKSWW
ncbi:hypothetical protein MY10362_000904 [Beauveria mimosiformis]